MYSVVGQDATQIDAAGARSSPPLLASADAAASYMRGLCQPVIYGGLKMDNVFPTEINEHWGQLDFV